MRISTVPPVLVGFLVFFAIAPACQAFHRYRPIVVLARDRETRQPIAGAEVRISYLLKGFQTPEESTGVTSEDGIVRLRAAPYGEADLILEVHAKGYLFEEKHLPVKDVEEIAPTHPFEAIERRPVNMLLELYAEPYPTVELVAPNDFHGLIKVEIRGGNAIPLQPGQRFFSYAVPASGIVEMTGPPLLRRAASSCFRVRRVDGTLVTCHAKGLEPGFWWLRSEGPLQCFVLGTKGEFEAMAHPDRDEDDTHPTPSGGNGGGSKGRHGH